LTACGLAFSPAREIVSQTKDQRESTWMTGFKKTASADPKKEKTTYGQDRR
jgi:hypothetical protein